MQEYFIIQGFQTLILQDDIDDVDDAHFNPRNRFSFRRQNRPLDFFDMVSPSPMTPIHNAFHDNSGYTASTPHQHPYPGTSDGSPPPPYTDSSYPGQELFSELGNDLSSSKTKPSSAFSLPRFREGSSRQPAGSRTVDFTESVQYTSRFNIHEDHMPIGAPRRERPNRENRHSRLSQYICSAASGLRYMNWGPNNPHRRQRENHDNQQCDLNKNNAPHNKSNQKSIVDQCRSSDAMYYKTDKHFNPANDKETRVKPTRFDRQVVRCTEYSQVPADRCRREYYALETKRKPIAKMYNEDKPALKGEKAVADLEQETSFIYGRKHFATTVNEYSAERTVVSLRDSAFKMIIPKPNGKETFNGWIHLNTMLFSDIIPDNECLVAPIIDIDKKAYNPVQPSVHTKHTAKYVLKIPHRLDIKDVPGGMSDFLP